MSPNAEALACFLGCVASWIGLYAEPAATLVLGTQAGVRGVIALHVAGAPGGIGRLEDCAAGVIAALADVSQAVRLAAVAAEVVRCCEETPLTVSAGFYGDTISI